MFFFFFFNFFFYYAPVSQANWCNMTFTAGNLFLSHSCIGCLESSPHRDSNPGPQIERQTTYQLSYPSPTEVFLLYVFYSNVEWVDIIDYWNNSLDDITYVEQIKESHFPWLCCHFISIICINITCFHYGKFNINH